MYHAVCSYFFWAVAHSIITAVKGWVFAHGVVRAALAFHNNLLANVLRAPLKYFHTTMSGRYVPRRGCPVCAAVCVLGMAGS